MKQKNNNFFVRPINFLIRWRPFPLYELISYVFMYASVPMLAYGIHSYNSEIIKIIFFSIFTLYSGFFAALIWNDITDVDIDKIAHPDRPVPKGTITKSKFFTVALIFSALTFIFAILVSVWCLFIVGMTALFVTFHNKFLKKRIKIPAYSEIFTPVQWLAVAVFGYFAIWTALSNKGSITADLPILGYISLSSYDFQNMIILVLFTYFADDAHDLPEGIHDVEGDKKIGVRTYATSFGEKTAAKISFVMFFISGLLGFILFYRTILSYVFLIPFIIIWIYMLSWSYKLIKVKTYEMKNLSSIVGRKGFDYLLISYNLIFLDIFIQLIIYHYF